MKAWYHVTIGGRIVVWKAHHKKLRSLDFLNVFEGQLQPKKLLEKINQ